METLLETIRIAVSPGASDDDKSRGAVAAQTIAVALGAVPGKPMTFSTTATTSPVSNVVGALRDLPAEQALDLLIAKLRALLPDPKPVAPQALKLAMVAPPRKPL